MKYSKNFYFIVLLSVLCVACSKPAKITSKTGELIAVDSTWDALVDTNFTNLLAPYKEAFNAEMNDTIGYALVDLPVGLPESPMLNWASDVLLETAKKLYKKPVDCAITNRGGIRFEWYKGPLTMKNIYEVFPFENRLVVLTLEGKDIIALCDSIAKQGGQGVSGLRMKIENKKAKDVTLNGKKIVPEAVYTVATNDYLSYGNDYLTPLANYLDIWDSQTTIRDVFTNYIKEHKEISAKTDGRIVVL